MNLVTGGTGLTGSHLLFELTKQGERVRATKRNGSSVDFVKKVFSLYNPDVSSQFELIEWVDADLLDFESLLNATTGIETVFHTGAVVSFNAKDAQSISETNVRGSANVVDACIQNGVKTLCHVSSIAALGESNSQGVVDESSHWAKSKGQSVYAKSKFFGELEVWRGVEQGLRVVIVNPSVILGPGRWETGSGQLFSRISKGMPFYTNGVTGYVDVRDVARAMVCLAKDSSINNERFILNAENLSYNDVFSSIAKSVGGKPPRYMIKPWMVNVVWPFIKAGGIIVGKGSAISRENIRSAFNKTYYSSDKIRKRLNFEFTPIAESISFIGKVFKNNIDL